MRDMAEVEAEALKELARLTAAPRKKRSQRKPRWKQHRQTEYEHQVALVDWANGATKEHSELALLFSINNGVRVSIGLAIKLRRAGLKAGIPDLMLPVARGKYHALFVEMKAPDTTYARMSAAQYLWHGRLADQGFCVYTCYGFEQAKAAILGYLHER